MKQFQLTRSLGLTAVLATLAPVAFAPGQARALEVSVGGDNGIGISADVDVDTDDGLDVSADLGVSVGGDEGIGTEVGADVGLGGSDGITADADVDLGVRGEDGVTADAVADVGLGGSNGISADVDADVGAGGGSLADADIDLNTDDGIDAALDVALGGSGTTTDTTPPDEQTAGGGTGDGTTDDMDEMLAFASASGGTADIALLRPEQVRIITISRLDRTGQASAASIDRQVANSGGWVRKLRARVASNKPMARMLASKGWIPSDVVGFYAREDGTYWLIVDDRV